MPSGTILARPQLTRQCRQHRGANPDTNEPERQLVEPIGIVKIGDRTFGQESRRQRCGDQQIELHRTGAQCRWQNQPQQGPHALGQMRPAQPKPDIGPPARMQQPTELQDAADRHAKRLHPRRLGRVWAVEKQHSRDQCHVEQDRRGGVNPEAPDRIQQPAHQRHEADQQQIRKRQPGEVNRKVELAGPCIGETTGQRPDDRRRADDHHHRKQQQERQQYRQYIFSKALGAGHITVIGTNLAIEHRHKGSRKSTFGKQRAE